MSVMFVCVGMGAGVAHGCLDVLLCDCVCCCCSCWMFCVDGCLSALVSVRRRAGGTTQDVSMVAMVAMVV